MKVGYIGLGLMGRPCAMHLHNAGHQLAVYARRETSAAPFAEIGATICATPAEVAVNADVIFTNVSDTPDVEQIILGKDGIIEGIKPDAVVVDMSTISPVVTRDIAQKLKEKGAHMLDAPVSGGSAGAESGTLSIMIGGEEAIVERIMPLFEVMGSNIVHIGDNGAGQVTKACNQIVITQTIAGVAEAYCLADAMDVDKAKVRQALLGGFANSKILEMHGQRMLDDNYDPGFKAVLHKKDMNMVLQAASALGVALPGSGVATQWLNALVGDGSGELDSSAIYKVMKKFNQA
ncbi:2-hydroxy-3-oxopropionate reductase [Solemya velum gill symbiont]|uniref:2-hydroxy-3-oxopropionate reductase n=2 Tax=Solemya velum gill symbiont TaxID=2340 RepID=A0A0B0H327_SOVGS|nr:3-hydroxyisobutyrate dehydrogenase-like protein [Solemya velum gill symbiont]OOY34079.1 2-hydroxy-3-oxopropionate reductase [Solemya velum gill symbiont]OOY36685.1 2-hydroxy-3-oxopropionate reductase [Solemya velum gill symbiont]OOY40547.1 2-hydroxy-3-oxopropionate reductase [Solemya velum gill symbiont]OOY44108.1 2-hydroxy-3-oxopropionate reductase [Solemya velum gill symbiont]